MLRGVKESKTKITDKANDDILIMSDFDVEGSRYEESKPCSVIFDMEYGFEMYSDMTMSDLIYDGNIKNMQRSFVPSMRKETYRKFNRLYPPSRDLRKLSNCIVDGNDYGDEYETW